VSHEEHGACAVPKRQKNKAKSAGNLENPQPFKAAFAAQESVSVAGGRGTFAISDELLLQDVQRISPLKSPKTP